MERVKKYKWAFDAAKKRYPDAEVELSAGNYGTHVVLSLYFPDRDRHYAATLEQIKGVGANYAVFPNEDEEMENQFSHWDKTVVVGMPQKTESEQAAALNEFLESIS